MHRAPEIGGYFELELPDHPTIHPACVRLQSARAAIHATLACHRVRRAFLPNYVCDSVLLAAREAGVDVALYDLDAGLMPRRMAPLRADEVLVYVNYFGLCDANVRELLETVPAENLIVDSSHGLFSEFDGPLATVYSPRKFCGLPDGGLLRASPCLQVPLPAEVDDASIDRTRHLLTRLGYSAREGYAAFAAARMSLHDTRPRRMSPLTQRLMRGIDWESMRARRRRNFAAMSLALDDLNSRHDSLEASAVPLCYVLTVPDCDVAALRTALSERNIFTPTYWPDARARVRPDSVEATLIDQSLFLPIDQRMHEEQVLHVARQVQELVATCSR
jgi:hypothetical protein